jgi:cytochrome c1
MRGLPSCEARPLTRRFAAPSPRKAGRGATVFALLLLLLAACRNQDQDTARQLTGGEPSRGRAAIQRYGCGACHTVSGVDSARGLVGPPLTGIASRTYLAGQLPNNPDNMKRWIREPQSIENGSAMPNLNVSEGDARDIAAYLYTLRQ